MSGLNVVNFSSPAITQQQCTKQFRHCTDSSWNVVNMIQIQNVIHDCNSHMHAVVTMVAIKETIMCNASNGCYFSSDLPLNLSTECMIAVFIRDDGCR